MSTWLISVNSKAFDFDSAFQERKNKTIELSQKNNKIRTGDIIYLYCSSIKAIKYKCLVIDKDIPFSDTVDDTKYVLDESFFKNKRINKFYLKIKLLDYRYIELGPLKAKGLKSLFIPQLINEELFDYLENMAIFNSINEDIKSINGDKKIPETQKKQLTDARIGQGLFRQKVIANDKKCAVTGIKNTGFLIASHIVPWKFCSNLERLDENNGILLSPHLDKLFDRYFISFTNDGKIQIFKDAAKDVLKSWNIDIGKKYFTFSEARKNYLEKHRKICEENAKVKN